MGKQRVFVAGVGMTKFEKPASGDKDYPDFAKEAATKALKDAAIPYTDVEQVVCGYVYGDSTCGQRAVYELGMTGVPVYNVNNACATGSSALFLAKQLVEGGVANCVLALGFEKMEKGSLQGKYSDRAIPVEKHIGVMAEAHGIAAAPVTPQMFGNAGREHMEKYGTRPEHFAKIAYKNHKHSVNNPLSQFQKEYTLKEIMNSRMVYEPLTKLQCCPTSDGAAAAVICNEEFVKQNPSIRSRCVEILGMEMATDLSSTFDEKSCIKMVGYDMTKTAAKKLYDKTGIQPTEAQVVELHDCFSTNELITYEALGLCPEGKGGEFVDSGNNTYGGKHVVNPSGGLISKGHPLGATGLAQCTELCSQLRGECGKRQVPGAVIALQHNLGLGGAVVVAFYRMAFPRYHGNAETGIKESDFKSAVVFKFMSERLQKEGAEIVKKIKAVFSFEITDGPNGKTGKWTADLKNGNGSLKYGDITDKADCTITMKDEDFYKFGTGSLNPQTAYFRGQLKVSGNPILGLKLEELLPRVSSSKL
ncbi:non-specific lipid-transfer protein-like [Dendronephthya gigantea]|uniref:non-specific lipid-transfer protein-like n=1 Tax=Dendronephthya gigantea TaxID=151771 RepID=UPI00106C0EA7|nr:non-specific lipid-transfer protein-like [Dendronephthya gigantea]